MNCPNCGEAVVPGARFCMRCAQPLAAAPPMVAPALAAPTCAGFWRRLLALVIDGLLLGLIHLLMTGLLGVAQRETMARMVFDLQGGGAETMLGLFATVATWLPWVVGWVYFAGLEALPLQATPGKRLLGIKVTDLHGRRASIVRTTLRNLFKPLSALLLMLGFLMAGVTARKQALHDLLAGCLLVTR